jgi:hypothetical protein
MSNELTKIRLDGHLVWGLWQQWDQDQLTGRFLVEKELSVRPGFVPAAGMTVTEGPVSPVPLRVVQAARQGDLMVLIISAASREEA